MRGFRITRLALILIGAILILTLMQMNNMKINNKYIISKSSAIEFVSYNLSIDKSMASDIAKYIKSNSIDAISIRDLGNDSQGYKTIEISDSDNNTYRMLVNDQYNIVDSYIIENNNKE